MKYWIEQTKRYKKSPLSIWVHRPVGSNIWLEANEYNPPLPIKGINNLFSIFKIEHKGVEFSFSSLEEIEHCIEVLAKKILPTTNELANNSWLKGYQHLHWLTKWPSDLKSFKDRQKIVNLLVKVKKINT